MATLRCPESTIGQIVLRSFTVCAAVGMLIGNGLAADPQPKSSPRTLMRLPRWIESLPSRESRAAKAKEPAPAAALRTSAEPEAPVQPTAGWRDLADDTSTAQPKATPTTQPKPVAPTAELKPTVTATEAAPPAQPPQQPADAANDAAQTAPVPATTRTPTTAPTTPTAAPTAPPAKSIAPPVAANPDDTPPLAVDPASFRGVYPGKTTREELNAAWGAGEAFSRDDGTHGFSWKIEPFERVEVVLEEDIVSSIRIKLAEPVAVADLAKQLEIADLRTVSVLDEQGVSIGQVFPERGVIFSLNPGTQSATAVMLEPLDAESFVLRAEGEIDTDSAHAAADLQYALQIDPQHLRAMRMLLAIRCEQGRWLDAQALVQKAETIDPVDIWTQLKHADVLLALERSDEARDKVTAVAGRPNVTPLVVAQTERMLGRIELAATKPDYQKAVEHFGTAIRTATPLVGAKSASVQKAARTVLLDAHLGTALAIAKGTWQQKARVIPKWITRSETIVKELDPQAANKDALELQLCRGALAVAAGSTDSIDPLPWVKRLLETRSRMNATTADTWQRRQLDWEVGQGLSDALVAAQKRGDATDMLENSTLTAAYLERAAEHRQLTDTERKSLGELMFRVGILYSLQQGDHATAVTWFDKTLPLWDGNAAFARDGEAGRLGESFVSMAISYWQVDRRDDAVTISSKGVDLMVEAVDQQQLEERSLAVAYGNLSTMYAEQGDQEKSRNYAEMASRAESSGTVLK